MRLNKCSGQTHAQTLMGTGLQEEIPRGNKKFDDKAGKLNLKIEIQLFCGRETIGIWWYRKYSRHKTIF